MGCAAFLIWSSSSAERWMDVAEALFDFQNEWSTLFLYIGNTLVWHLSIIQMLSSVSIGISALSREDGMQLGNCAKYIPLLLI